MRMRLVVAVVGYVTIVIGCAIVLATTLLRVESLLLNAIVVVAISVDIGCSRCWLATCTCGSQA